MSDKKNPNGIVLYEGPSQLDGEQIVVIATGFANTSANRKTGNMIQTWILRADKKPTEAWKDDSHTSVCGECKHAHSKANSCYVNLGNGPNGVWKAWMNNRYEKGFTESAEGPVVKIATANKFIGQATRFGSFGDPVAVPFSIWEPILAAVKGTATYTGYTHSWTHEACTDDYKRLCVASVDNLEELSRAREAGWRTFRTMMAGEEPGDGEFLCPASDEGKQLIGREITCVECGACNGKRSSNDRRGSAAIFVHGLSWKSNNYVGYRTITEKQVELTVSAN